MLSLALLALGSLAPRMQEAAAPQAPDTQSIDDVIARLPTIGRESTLDDGKWIPHPPVAQLEEHLARGGALTDDQWRRALLRSRAIRVRERWPAEEPFAIGVEVPRWLQPAEICARPIDAFLSEARGGRQVDCGNCATATFRRERYQAIGRLVEPGRHRLPFDVVVERRTPRVLNAKVEVLWSGRIDFEVEVVATHAEALPPVHDETLDAAVRRLLVLRRVEDWLGADIVRERPAELAGVAVSLQLEVSDAGKMYDEGVLRFVERPGWVTTEIGIELPLHPTPEAVLRIRGNAEQALEDWDAERHWAGEIVIPLTELESD